MLFPNACQSDGLTGKSAPPSLELRTGFFEEPQFSGGAKKFHKATFRPPAERQVGAAHTLNRADVEQT
jgi:hypothetical protein